MDMLIPISFFAAVFGIFYVYFQTRSRERMALIEKGENAAIFKPAPSGSSALKYGILFIGIALGILAGHILNTLAGFKEEVAFFSMIFLFGGSALVMFYFLINRGNK
jgi:hypothetical protein